MAWEQFGLVVFLVGLCNRDIWDRQNSPLFRRNPSSSHLLQPWINTPDILASLFKKSSVLLLMETNLYIMKKQFRKKCWFAIPLWPLMRALVSFQPWQCFHQDCKDLNPLWLLPNRLGVTSVTLQELVLLMLTRCNNIRVQEQTFLTWTTQMKSAGNWSRFPAWRKWMPHL